MNIIFVINIIYLLVLLARPAALNLTKNESFYNLIIPKIPANPCLKLVPCPALTWLVLWKISAVSSTKKFGAVVNSWFNQKHKTNPKRTQTNPIFPRANLILSERMGILDKFGTTFLCKTNPILPSGNLIFYT